MNTQAPKPQGDSDCSSSGKRNRFFRGKTLKAGEFQLEQDYLIQRRRLLTRAIAGWGVVYGIRLEGPRQEQDSGVKPPPGAVSVTPGLALDRHGREVALPAAAALGGNNTFLMEGSAAGCQARLVDTIPAGAYLLAIHYAERRVGDAAPQDDCGCDLPERPFICETVLFSLTPLGNDDCPCGEPDCPEGCGCGGHDCGAGDLRARQSCLCEWTSNGPQDLEARWCTWNGYEVDLLDGVSLACVWIAKAGDKCSPALSGWVIDDCGPRRAVKSNDLLYNLIRGCDLTRIQSLSWDTWHRREQAVPWEEFVKKVKSEKPDDPPDATQLAITFTGPVQAKTVTIDCFSFTFDVTGEDTGWNQSRVVPITNVLTSSEPADPADTTRTARLCVDSGWLEEILSKASKFTREGGTGRIEVYGDFILDCHGQAVDANARGFALRDEGDGRPVPPSGNGAPGGTLISVFRIEARPQPAKVPYPPQKQ